MRIETNESRKSAIMKITTSVSNTKNATLCFVRRAH